MTNASAAPPSKGALLDVTKFGPQPVLDVEKPTEKSRKPAVVQKSPRETKSKLYVDPLLVPKLSAGL